ncbi:tyrosine-type recombinase/integrase [Hyalangium minutum]|uniref:Core-binding (CB) domain-containing protein n=1 Tax=Hyalangium minutum TaxID=394096 RepID=A0A085VXD5_9BACT|nr:tyrosine-type recombinase/integrase [Hyalangium minutum]KFE60098.1 hypothetical protein DB31_5969 [Hyalangium minutum]
MSHYEDDDQGRDAWRLEDPAQLAPLPERRQGRQRRSSRKKPAQPHGKQLHKGSHTAPPIPSHLTVPAQGDVVPVEYGASVHELQAEVVHPIQHGLFRPLAPPTVRNVVNLYLEHCLKEQGRALSTYESYAPPLRWFTQVLPPFPTPGQVKDVLQWRLNLKEGDKRRLVPTTANQYKKYLSAAYKYARNWWPMVALRDPTTFPNWKVGRRKPRGMADPATTFRLLLAHACKNDTERAFLCVLGLLGLRVSEARGLRWDTDLSPDWRKLTVQRQRVARRKGEQELKTVASFAHFDVTAVLCGFLLGAWKERKEALAGNDPWGRRDALSPYMFNYGQARLQELMERIRDVAPEDFPRKTGKRGALAFHGFRDTLGAVLASTNSTLGEGQQALRHDSYITTSLYFQNHQGKPTANAALLKAQAVLVGGIQTERRGLHLVKEGQNPGDDSNNPTDTTNGGAK